VFHYYLNFFIEQKKYQSLYACESRACGSNAHWANVIFSQRVLNGIEDTQRYVAMRAPFASHVDYIALYFVQRGNKQNYIHLDLIDVDAETSATKSEEFSLASTGFVALNGLVFSAAGELNVERSQGALTILLEWLRKNPQQRVAFVGHTVPRSDIELALKQSKLAADTTLAYVKAQKAGASSELLTYGVGPLAPRFPEQKSEAYWVELVRFSP
jgi:outer membrane protein OmpA-like peptidoglycan-associated protein